MRLKKTLWILSLIISVYILLKIAFLNVEKNQKEAVGESKLPPLSKLLYRSSEHLSKKQEKTVAETQLSALSKWLRVDELNEDALVNRHQYVLHLDSNICKSRIDVLFVIHSAVGNVEQRKLIRSTWASVTRLNNTFLKTVFLLGETLNSTLQERVLKESKQNGDLVQGNFLDTYRNLTYKHVMAFHWLTLNCKDSRTIVKADDDVLINVNKIVEFSSAIGHYHDAIYCSVFTKGGPRREVDDKWYMTKEEYPFEFFPDYCEGLAYILGLEEVKRLYRASERTRFFWVDDLYATGFLAERAGLKHRGFHPGHQYQMTRRFPEIKFERVMFFVGYSSGDWNKYWNRIQ